MHKATKYRPCVIPPKPKPPRLLSLKRWVEGTGTLKPSTKKADDLPMTSDWMD